MKERFSNKYDFTKIQSADGWRPFHSLFGEKEDYLELEIDSAADLLKDCESPIEMLFVLQFMYELQDGSCYNTKEGLVYGCRLDLGPCLERFNVTVIPQVPIHAGGHIYRGDFGIILSRWESYQSGACVHFRLVVELDGHDFHEKTKEQAKRDKKRDRAMAAKGLTVLRFTGSEVYKDPGAACREVMELLESKANEVVKNHGL